MYVPYIFIVIRLGVPAADDGPHDTSDLRMYSTFAYAAMRCVLCIRVYYVSIRIPTIQCILPFIHRYKMLDNIFSMYIIYISILYIYINMYILLM